MRVAAIVVAAGGGIRAGGGIPKQFRHLSGKPVLGWSLVALQDCAQVHGVVLVRNPMHDAHLHPFKAHGLILAEGGSTRIASVRAGLAAAAALEPDVVLIHDAARPGLTHQHVAALLDAVQAFDAVAPALPVADALKRGDGSTAVRTDLFRVQTPQAVRFAPYAAALASIADDAALDDDLAIASAAGLRVGLIPGDERLFKITRPEDFAHMARLLAPDTPPSLLPCAGSGFDAHRFGPGDHVTLCGVKISHSAGLVGHSDADAGWHALTDAILGAIGAGDIGDYFPPSDPQWKGAPSEVFLHHAAELVRAAGGRIANVDVTLICERPKIKPHREAMRARTAEVLGLPLARVSVKATTTEAMGFTGREEGLAAQASAMVLLPQN